MDEEKINIIWTDYDVGNRIENKIFLNKNLKKKEYSDLYGWILAHELAHSDDKKYSWNDFKLDFNVNDADMLFKLFLFQLRHPKSLTQLSPVKKYNGEFYWDMSLLIQYILALLIIAFLYFI